MKKNNKSDYEELLTEMDKTEKILIRRDLELNEVNAELDDKLYQLKEEQKKHIAIVDNFSDGLLIFDENSILSSINKKSEEFFEISKENYIGKLASELANDIKVGSLFDVITVEIQDAFRKEFKLKDMILEVTAAPIFENKYGKFVILHDTTREKRVQSLKSEFVSIAAHQLRTPLSAIKWTVTSMLDGDFGEFNEEQRKYLEQANFSNERMINLVDDLLNLSRIEEGRYVYKNASVRVGDLLQAAVSTVETKIKNKNIKLNIEKMEKLPEIIADQEKIKLVIQNFLDNAINYSYKSGTVYVSVEDNPSRREILFKIKDEGIEIPKEQKDRIFTKFFRAENALRTETVGSGLGLFINKNIIEAHGGKTWFESGKKKGTIFYFTLPYGYGKS